MRAAAAGVVWAISIGSLGCRVQALPAVPVAPPVALTLFRADSGEFPMVAAALNERLDATYPEGPSVHRASVTLEEAQVAVGCADETPECWSALADPIKTSALLVAEVKSEGRLGVRVSLRIFDAGAQKTLRLAERVYDNPPAAVQGVPEIVAALSRAPQAEP